MVYGLVNFLKELGSGTVFFVLVPAAVLIAALVIWRLAELYGEELITIGEFVVVVSLLLSVIMYLVANWRDTAPYIAAAAYLTCFLIYVHLREGSRRRVKVSYEQIKASLTEVRQAGLRKEAEKRARTARAERSARSADDKDAEERVAVCPFCKRESLIVRGKCMGCGQNVSKARELLD